MSNSGETELTLSRMNRKKAVQASEEISDLLKEAFEKHKDVCRGYQRLEEDLRLLRLKTHEDAKKLDNMTRENKDLMEELSEAKLRIVDLSRTVTRLQAEVAQMSRRASGARNSNPVKESGRLSAPPSARNQPTKTASPEPSNSSVLVDPHSRISGVRNFGSSHSEEAIPLSSDEDAEKPAEDTVPAPSKIRRQLFSNGQSKKDTSPDSLPNGMKRKRPSMDFIPETPPPAPQRPLQTNTCKVCERYWRAEDERTPGQLKSFDLPYCRIHGKNQRPPCTPENFWKQARLTSPKH